ncbi:phospholipase D-like domain-containing protein [Salicibibacter kimchii]|uniref:Cardiolipin synthase n=1 Tax=Salicibibacter kimchii TaxID=2099786 RepID=A0A345BZM8_9BACI|nr:phospholipase D-like domain-containing protein [Salicibibacter kimchii]AXF56409.1 cardiolipin synthase [Salicibibacter kimchii]
MFTTIVITIIVLVLLIAIWFIIDFRLGRKRHQQLASTAKIYPLRHSDTELMKDGRRFFQRLFADIEQAQDHVHTSVFIIKEPGIGTQLLALLERKARDGVTVKLLVDRFGSRLANATTNRLKHSGISFAYAHKPKFPFIFYSANRRYHRKITVVDGKVAYLGGFNVGDEYVGKDKLGYWRDYHVRMEKEGVADLQEVFLDDWAEAGGAPPANLMPSTAEQGSEPLQLLASEGLGYADHLIDWFDSAKTYAMIASPYYVPGGRIQDAVVNMGERGVKVDVLIPQKKDHPLVHDAAYAYFRELLQAGCTIYEYTSGFFHGKAIIIDGKFANIGSAKFDKRSFFLNDELDLFFHDEGKMIEEAEAVVRKDMQTAKKITIQDVENRTWLENLKTKGATWISDLL